VRLYTIYVKYFKDNIDVMETENSFDLFPKTLYKYRDWYNDYHKQILTENQIFLSSQNAFNDPFDAVIPFRYDEREMTSENIFKKLYETGHELMKLSGFQIKVYGK